MNYNLGLSEIAPLNLTEGQHPWLIGVPDSVEDLACIGRPPKQFFLSKQQDTISHIHAILLSYHCSKMILYCHFRGPGTVNGNCGDGWDNYIIPKDYYILTHIHTWYLDKINL
jgi:hypothetical protein